MNQRASLVVDFCSYQAAKFAVESWHYSKTMPAGKTVKVGAWEDGRFIGAVVYSLGANKNIGRPYGLKQVEVCELVRVALTDHKAPVSRIVSMAQKKLIETSPGLRLVVSYADPERGHNGAIYQAMNWFYVGAVGSTTLYLHRGKYVHQRTASSAYATIEGLPSKKLPNKHKYLYPLDRAMRRQIEPLAKPYPKRNPPPVNGDNRVTNAAERFNPDSEAL